jgi:hypothetical protein
MVQRRIESVENVAIHFGTLSGDLDPDFFAKLLR